MPRSSIRTGVAVTLLALSSTLTTGCGLFNIFDLFDFLRQSNGQLLSDNLDPNAARGAPETVAGAVIVEISNPTDFDANVTVVMTVAGVQVHAARRFVPAGSQSTIVGPDNADAVSIEAVLINAGEFAPESAGFLLGRDFQSGDVIRYEVMGPPEAPDRPAPDQTLGELVVAVLGIDQPIFAVPGDVLTFQVQIAELSPTTTYSVFADRDTTPASGDELLIVENAAAQELATVRWDTTGVAPGAYHIYSEARDTGRFARSPVVVNTITLLDAIAVQFLPQDQSTNVCAGDGITQAVQVLNVSPTATYTFFLDPDGAPDSGDETPFGVNTPVALIDPIGVNVPQLAAGDLFVYVEITDGARTARFASPDVFRVFAPATLAILGLDTDVRVAPGDPVAFSVRVAETAPGATLDLLAAPLDPNKPAVPIISDVPAVGETDVIWNTGKAAPGAYEIRGTLSDPNNPCGGELTAVAAGRVHISNPPLLSIFDPNDGAILRLDQQIVIDYLANDPDDDAEITFYLDTDGVLNGNETLLIGGISEDAQPTGPLAVNPPVTAGGAFFILGVINDGFSSVVTVGPSVCLTERMIGVFDLSKGQIPDAITIRGGPLQPDYRNELFGFSLDISRDIDGLGGTDILIGDPNALVDSGEGLVPVGAAYYHRLDSGSPTPQTLAATDMQTRLVFGQFASLFGAATAFVTFDDPNDPNDDGPDVWIGAPGTPAPQSFLPDGATFAFEGAQVINQAGELNAGVAAAWLSAEPSGQFFGLTAAMIEDIDGDGVPEAAAGAPRFNAGRGRVVILPGGAPRPSGSLANIGETLRGTVWTGVDPNENAGVAIADAGDFDSNLFGDVLIGAPGADNNAGRVYLLLGDPNFIDSQPHSLAEVGLSQPGTVFLGQPGDQAGASLAIIFADSDNRPDLLIGAPGANNGAGRVYLVYNTPALFVGVVALADVGASVPGVVIDGLAAGDGLGMALANVGDFDLDGRADFALGAPFARNSRGEVYVIYGDPNLSGSNLLSRLATCERVGFKLIGAFPGDALGYALSGGDVDGDGFADVGVGAPGFGAAHGAVYIILGRTFAPGLP